LRIFNNYTLIGAADAGGLAGSLLVDTSETEEHVVFSFEGGKKLSVSLEPESYNGPEAMVLNREGKPIVVWN
jgi:hypothetical protein